MKLLLLLLPVCAFGFGFLRPHVDSSGELSSEDKLKMSEAWGIDLDARKARLDRISQKAFAIETSKPKSQFKNRIQSIRQNQLTKPNEGVVFDLFKVNDREGVSDYLFEGDIVLTESQLDEIENGLVENHRKKRQVPTTANKWTNNTLYFYFDASVEDYKKDAFRGAQKYLQAHTCINFVENQTAENRVKVYNGTGCSSYLGMRGGEQLFSMGRLCGNTGTAAHELIHALGFIHTQSRSDRDTYVDVDLSNVAVNKYKNFVEYQSDQNILFTPYEYGSIMHYAADASARSGYSIMPKDENYLYTLGSRQISFYDLRMLNDFYNCNATCPADKSAVCKNGGYPNPRNCAECNCPRGYGGALCDEKPSNCGKTLEATKSWQTAEIEIKESDVRSTNGFKQCTNWIKAPVGKRVQVKITEMRNVFCEYGCAYNGIEVKAKADNKITNPLYCCREYRNTTVVSELNPAPIVAYTSSYVSFEIEYRFVNGKKPTVKPTPATKKTTPTTTTTTTDTTTTTTTTPTSTSTKASEATTTKPTAPEATTETLVSKATTKVPVVPIKNCVEPLSFSQLTVRRMVDDQTDNHRYHSDNFFVQNWASTYGYRVNGQIGKVINAGDYETNTDVLEPLCPSLVKLRAFISTTGTQALTVDEDSSQNLLASGWYETLPLGYCSSSKACGANRNLRSVTANDKSDIVYSTYNKELNDLNDSPRYEGSLSSTICWLF